MSCVFESKLLLHKFCCWFVFLCIYMVHGEGGGVVWNNFGDFLLLFVFWRIGCSRYVLISLVFVFLCCQSFKLFSTFLR